ncbi:MAG: DUF2203 domain-containing protein [Ignavibacteriales bacterium]|nr:DUF2203 domain-containing protein [Ignavibacteriales bacterium]
MPQTDLKYFTPEEANKTLPLVKKIVKDILDTVFQIRTIAESLGGNIDGNKEIEQYNAQLNYYMRELEEIGCSYKDWNFQIGLVDFPAMIEGEEVLLCWRSDEDSVKFYHGIEEGYVGRKPIPEEYL